MVVALVGKMDTRELCVFEGARKAVMPGVWAVAIRRAAVEQIFMVLFDGYCYFYKIEKSYNISKRINEGVVVDPVAMSR